MTPSVSGGGEGSERPAGGGEGQSGSRQPREGDKISVSFSSPAGKHQTGEIILLTHLCLRGLMFLRLCVGGPGSEGRAREEQQAAPSGDGTARKPAGRRRKERKNPPLGTPLSFLCLGPQ